jgi:hypothetical protein
MFDDRRHGRLALVSAIALSLLLAALVAYAAVR